MNASIRPLIANYAYLVLAALSLTACSSALPQCPEKPVGNVVYVTKQGWHTEIGIPVDQLGPALAFYKNVFPEAHFVMFGYGKKTFVTAPAEELSEYFIGLIPGTATIHAMGITVTPALAYPDDTVTLALPKGGSEALANFIWHDLAKDASGKPYIVASSTNPDGLFYAAESRYTIVHTCNSWIADALHTAGLPVAEGAIFSGQLMSQVINVSKGQCDTP